MPLMFLIDEHLRGDLRESLITAAQVERYLLQVLEIGDADAPALGTKDPELLMWLEEHEYILISRDVNTLPEHLAEHLARGHSCPGIFLIRPEKSWHEVLDDLVLLAIASLPEECRDQIRYVPL